MLRYSERNPLRAGFVERAQDWRWSSALQAREGMPALDAGRVARPDSWLQHVNEPPAEVERLRLSVRRGRPYGEAVWSLDEETARPFSCFSDGAGRQSLRGEAITSGTR
ncbi:MAG TPA: hypothetical protein VGY66_10630 [Gemmataceae bacterium]|nr:hypothetical protein [Gemmataceae bacterium]